LNFDPKKQDPDVAPELLAHDLRAAVAGLILSLGQMKIADLSEGDRLNLNQARAAASTLRDLLDISMGIGPTVAREVALADLAQRIDSRWRKTADEKGLALRVDVAEDAPQALIVATAELHRIFDNLVGNALKFCDSGEVAVVFESDDSGGLQVTIIDDGPGFSDSALSTLFEIYSRPADALKDGSGLGLFITKTLMSRFDAVITANNRPLGGACIQLSFPAKLSAGASRQAELAPDAPKKLPDLTGLHILVAEDNLTNQLVVGQMLEVMGAQFKLASDGVEALEMFEADNYDLVLLDIEMPRLTGLDVIRRIRARTDSRQATSLLALTAYAMPDHIHKIVSLGANGVIAKPLTSLAELGNAVLGQSTAKLVVEKPRQDPPQKGALDEIDPNIYGALTKAMGPEVMGELIEKIASDLGEVHENLLKGLTQKDIGYLRSATHNLISLAGTIGASNLQNYAQVLNAEVKSAPWIEVEPKIKVAVGAVESVLTFVAKEIGNW